MPESFFILSKDYLELASDEIIAISKMYDRFSKVKVISNLVIIQSKTSWNEIAKRASFVKVSGQILRKMSRLFLNEDNFETLKNAKTFVCRVINLSAKQFNIPELESSMGDMISKFSHAKVKLEDPDITIYLIFTDKENFFGFSKRTKEENRPKKIKNYPHELDWKLTRVMINLIGLKEGETVCDPFCGTGTTLLEAESMGIRAIGLDFDEKMYDRFAKTKVISNLIIIQSKTSWNEIAKRASFVKVSGQILRKMSGLFLDEDNFGILKNAKTFVCRIINLSSNQFNIPELESSMGDMISKFSNSKVELEDPDITIYLIFTDKENFFGFSKRIKEENKPKKIKNHPHELDWKLTRVMINLTGLKEGETVCDPFCGTGTTLLEAESMGIHAIGLDFDEKMCEISKENLKANGYKSKVFRSDFKDLSKISGKFDGIVTDLPYGRASKASEKPEEILKKFFSILPKRKKIAIMYKKELDSNLKLRGLKKYEIYRHKSLTRTILIK